MWIKGDKVAVLDDAMEGKVVEVKNKRVTIETTDGFELIFDEKELIKIGKNDLNFNLATQSINQIIKEKEIPKPRSFVKEKKVKEVGVPEFDLHIEKLVKNFRGMSSFFIQKINNVNSFFNFTQSNFSLRNTFKNF